MTGSERSIPADDAESPVVSARPRRSLSRRIAAYGLTRGATEGLLSLRSVLLAILLGPAGFGSWALVRLGMRYAALGRLGVLRGLELELLRPDARSRTSKDDSPARTSFGFILLVGGGIAALALGAAALVPDQDHRLLLAGFAVVALAESVYAYALVCTRIRTTLRRYAILETSTAALHVILGVGLASVWGLAGAFGGLALADLVGVAVAARWVDFRPALVPEQLRRLFKVGLPMTLTTCVGILLITGDRWIVTWWGGATMLGYYSFGASVTSVAAGLALVIRTVVFREVYGEASSAGAAQALRSHLENSLLPFARMLPPLLGAIGLVVGPAVALALPEYTLAIAPGRIFLFAGTAVGLVNLAAVGAIAAGHQHQLPVFAGIALAVTASLSVLALVSGLGLEGVAGAALLGHMFFAAAVLRVIVRETGRPDPARFVLITLLPLAWCAAAVVIVGRILPAVDPASAALGLGAYFLVLLPLVPGWRTELRRLRSSAQH